MARKKATEDWSAEHRAVGADAADLPGNAMRSAHPSALLDTRVIQCGDSLEQLRKLPPACVDRFHIAPPFNSNRNCEVFWGETKEKRAFEDRHESTRAYVDYMRLQNAVVTCEARRFSRERNSDR